MRENNRNRNLWVYRCLTIFLIVLILTRYLQIKNNLDQARQSGRSSVIFRYFEELEQKGSSYVYYSGGIRYVLPEKVQAKIGSMIKIDGIVSSMTYSVPSLYSSEIRLINQSIIPIQESSNSGILFLGNFYEKMVKTRGKVVNLLHFSLPEPHSSIAAGMLLGVREDFDKEEYERLQIDGLLHVVAASGSNVIIFMTLLEEILRKTPKGFRVLFLLPCIWIYCGFAHFSPTIVRACLMSTLQITARAMGKEYIGLWALFLSAAAMLVLDPYLFFSLGFQLSILASFAMAEVYPPLVKIFRSLHSGAVARILEGTFLSSVAVTLISAPLLIYQFGSFSIISFASNLAMLWIVPYIMTFSALYVALSWIFPNYSSISSIPLWLFCELWVRLTRLFAIVPYAMVEVPKVLGFIFIIPSIYAVFMIYRRAKYVL